MVTKAKVLTALPTKAPNLPIAPVDYSQQFQDQFSNVLRLYFNQLDNLTSSFLSGTFGDSVKFPYGSFYDTTSQHDGSTTIPYAIRFNSTDTSSGVYIASRAVSVTASISTTTLTCTAILSGRFYPSMILSGTGVTAGTYIYLQLSSTATPIAGTQTRVSGGGSGTNTFVVSGGTGAIEARQFVSGTGVPANTRVVSAVYDPTTTNTTVVLSANFTVNASGNYVFRPWGYTGTYSVSPSQTVASTTIRGTLPSMITFDTPGVYNVQFSLQFANTDTQAHDVDIWFKQNDVTLDNSNSQLTIPSSHGGVDGHLIAALNYFCSVEAGDVIEIVWHTSDSSVYIEDIPPQTSPLRPETPSAIATVSFVSALP